MSAILRVNTALWAAILGLNTPIPHCHFGSQPPHFRLPSWASLLPLLSAILDLKALSQHQPSWALTPQLQSAILGLNSPNSNSRPEPQRPLIPPHSHWPRQTSPPVFPHPPVGHLGHSPRGRAAPRRNTSLRALTVLTTSLMASTSASTSGQSQRAWKGGETEAQGRGRHPKAP